VVAGPDPRREEDTEEVPSLSDAFTPDPARRALTGYIVARAAALLTLLQKPGADPPLEGEDEDDDAALRMRQLDHPAWDGPEFDEALVELGVTPRRPSKRELRAWARGLPDDASVDAPYDRIAERQAAAAGALLESSQSPAGAALALITASLLDEHPMVRVAAAAATEWHDRTGPPAPDRRNPFARAILDDAIASRSDEVATVAMASLIRRRSPLEGAAAEVESVDRGAAQSAEPAKPNAALIHGTWARRKGWWRPDGAFHRFLRSEARVFPGLYSGEEAWRWSGYYSFRSRIPFTSEDWSRQQAGGWLAWWTHENLSSPPDLIGHSCGASVAMLATRVRRHVKALVLLSPSVHKACTPDPSYYRGALVVYSHTDLALRADGSRLGLLRRLPRVEFRKVRRKGLAGHVASRDPTRWHEAGLDTYVRDTWLPRL
jgi:hypothetical protein